MFFGEKKPEGKTVLLLDVENGSVGGAFVRIEADRHPRLFGVSRKTLPVLHTISSATIAQKALGATRELLSHLSTIAARLRGHQKLRPLGTVAAIEVFLSPPWTQLITPHWQHEETLVSALSQAVSERFGYVPLSVHPVGKPLISVTRGLYPEDEMLLSSITGEVSELLLIQGGAIAGRATIPLGHHLLLRTLKSHAGLGEEEARSQLRLPAQAGLKSSPFAEALGSARSHYGSEFKEVARQLLRSGTTRSVVIVSQEPVGEWFARSLAQESLQDIFPHGGTIRALRAQHLAPHVEGVGKDLFLMLQALYVDAHSSAIASAAV